MAHGVKNRGIWLAALPLAAAIAACSSPTTVPTEQLALGNASIEAAQGAGAGDLGQPDLAQARDKLARAQAAARAGDSVTAARLAEQADIDAQVARTRVSANKAQRAAAELDASIAALRDELNRAASTPLTRP